MMQKINGYTQAQIDEGWADAVDLTAERMSTTGKTKEDLENLSGTDLANFIHLPVPCQNMVTRKKLMNVIVEADESLSVSLVA